MPSAKNIHLNLTIEAVEELPARSGGGGGPMPETIAFIQHLTNITDVPDQWHLVATGSRDDISRLASRLYGMREHGSGLFAPVLARFSFEKRRNGDATGSFYARYDGDPK